MCTHSVHLIPRAFTLLCPSLSCVMGPGVHRCWYSCESLCVCYEAAVPRLPLKKTELPSELLLWAANAHPSPSICSSKPPPSSTHTSKTQLPLFYPSRTHFNTYSNSIYSAWTCVSVSGTVGDFNVLMSHPCFFPHPQKCVFMIFSVNLFRLYFLYYTGLNFRILLQVYQQN